MAAVARVLPRRRRSWWALPSRQCRCPTGRLARFGAPCRDGSGVDFAATLERTAQGDLVGVLEVAPDREAARDTGGAHPDGLEQPGQVHGGGLALDVGVGGEDHLGDALGVDPGQQLLHPQLLRPDALDGRDRTLQHVVTAGELVGALHGDDVARLLDDAERRGVAPLVEAVAAELAFGDVEATPAPRDALLRLG